MHVEVSVALNFVISYLYTKLPRRRVDMFAEELEKSLKKKFEGHWYPERPFKGSGFRCIPMNGEKVDPAIVIAALECGLDIEEIKACLPADLTLWIDPNEVSYRIGEKGVVKILYSDKERDRDIYLDHEIQAASKGFNPEAQSFKPIETLSSSMGSINLSPSSPTSTGGWRSASPVSAATSPVNPFFHQRPQVHARFTTASFAATKFGSTKLKSQAKRPQRLSPTEFNVLKQRTLGPQQASPMFNVGALNLASPQHQQQEGFPNPHLFGTQPLPNIMRGSLGDLYNQNGLTTMGTPASITPSPDGNKAFMEGLNLSSMANAYPAQFQHMLVAN